MTAQIDHILAFLADGKWHTITELGKIIDLPFEKIDDIIHFLQKNDFVELGEDFTKVRIKQDLQKASTDDKVDEAPTAAAAPAIPAALEKPKVPVYLTIKGVITSISNVGDELTVTGHDIELEEMTKNPEKNQVRRGVDSRSSLDDALLFDMVKYLLDDEWHRYDEITAKFDITTESLVEIVTFLKRKDLVSVHDKFGMMRLRHGVKLTV